MNLYLDTSVLIALFVTDPHQTQAEVLVGESDSLILSDLGAAEFASALSGLHRAGRISDAGAREVFANFDSWIGQACRRAEMAAADIRAAEGFMRRLDLTLRTPDALHIAIAQRLGVSLGTFDTRMASDARRLGVVVLGS